MYDELDSCFYEGLAIVWASRANGIWAGCMTHSPTRSKTLCTVDIYIVGSHFLPCMPSVSTTCFRFLTVSVVHGKGSLWNSMQEDDWQRAAKYRLLLGHLFGNAGKKCSQWGASFPGLKNGITINCSAGSCWTAR